VIKLDLEERYEKLDAVGKSLCDDIGHLVLDAVSHRNSEWERVIRDTSYGWPDVSGHSEVCKFRDEILGRMGGLYD